MLFDPFFVFDFGDDLDRTVASPRSISLTASTSSFLRTNEWAMKVDVHVDGPVDELARRARSPTAGRWPRRGCSRFYDRLDDSRCCATAADQLVASLFSVTSSSSSPSSTRMAEPRPARPGRLPRRSRYTTSLFDGSGRSGRAPEPDRCPRVDTGMPASKPGRHARDHGSRALSCR